MLYTPEIHDQLKELDRLKTLKKQPKTKIYYAEARLARLIRAETEKRERICLSQERSVGKTSQGLPKVSPVENRAYVLSCETHDLIKAILVM